MDSTQLTKKELLKKPITTFDLKPKTYGRFGYHSRKISNLEELLKFSEEQFLNLRKIGEGTLNEIKQLINSFGYSQLHFGMTNKELVLFTLSDEELKEYNQGNIPKKLITNLLDLNINTILYPDSYIYPTLTSAGIITLKDFLQMSEEQEQAFLPSKYEAVKSSIYKVFDEFEIPEVYIEIIKQELEKLNKSEIKNKKLKEEVGLQVYKKPVLDTIEEIREYNKMLLEQNQALYETKKLQHQTIVDIEELEVDQLFELLYKKLDEDADKELEELRCLQEIVQKKEELIELKKHLSFADFESSISKDSQKGLN
ncbi:MAG: hypothetical protein IJ093_01425 [Bacilli bacterium]|nr:hypothetical protein [Bacilli bacterium]